MQGTICLKPAVVRGLVSADVYCLACANVFKDSKTVWKGWYFLLLIIVLLLVVFMVFFTTYNYTTTSSISYVITIQTPRMFFSGIAPQRNFS